MPSLLKLTIDGSYMKHCETMHKQLKNINAKTKNNLLKQNDNMEEDEWRERVEILEELAEEYKMIGLNQDASSSDNEDVADDY
jgi:hypothetical protein